MTDRARRLRVLGVVALVTGVVAAVALWLLAGNRYDDAVAELAPAPIGCDTTLVFDRAGTYTLFLETKGSVGEIDGDCETDDRSYDLGDDDPPRVDLTLLDDDGGEVDLDRVDGPGYDRSGAAGRGYRSVEIGDTGDYVLTADAADDEVMIRVGRDPSDGVAAMRGSAVAALLVGIGVGVLALVAARRRPVPLGVPVAGPTSAWPQPGYHPPPTAPPYANPSVPPPYAVRRPVPQAPPAQQPPPGVRPGSGQPLPPPRPPS